MASSPNSSGPIQRLNRTLNTKLPAFTTFDDRKMMKTGPVAIADNAARLRALEGPTDISGCRGKRCRGKDDAYFRTLMAPLCARKPKAAFRDQAQH